MINEYIQIYVTSICTYVYSINHYLFFPSGGTIVFFCKENILKLQLIRQTYRKLMNNFPSNPVD
jgi:hypothetical protein